MTHSFSISAISFLLSTISQAQDTRPVPPAKDAGGPHITIHIVNAQTNKPVTNERLNVALSADQLGSAVLPTDKNGLIVVKTGDATTVRILSNFYADCRSRAELYTNYSLADIHKSGIITGNLCNSAHPASKPGELLLFVIPKTYIRTMGQPPVTNLPHSDENPNVPAEPPAQAR